MTEDGFGRGALSGSRAPPTSWAAVTGGGAPDERTPGRRRGCGPLEPLLLAKVSREAWEHGAEVVGSGRRAEGRRRRRRASPSVLRLLSSELCAWRARGWVRARHSSD
jgi:hypothetical protein